MSLGVCQAFTLAHVICRLGLLCCPEHSHGPAVVSAATAGILACGDLKRLEKAAEI